MQYILVLREKKFKKDILPKTVQKKIETVEVLLKKVKEFESLTDLESSEKDDLKRIKNRLDILDKELIKSINKFKPEIYKKKLDVMNQVRVKRHKKGEPKESEVEVAPKSVTKESQGQLISENKINDNLEVLEKSVSINTESLVEEPLLIEAEEIDNLVDEFENEFEKVSEATPKKMSKGMILLGIGFFFATLGVVNMWNERK